MNQQTWCVYFDYTGAGRGPEPIAGPFETEKEAEKWMNKECPRGDADYFVAETDAFEPDDEDDSMDGDHASALASAGWGTDEDYGYFGGDE